MWYSKIGDGEWGLSYGGQPPLITNDMNLQEFIAHLSNDEELQQWSFNIGSLIAIGEFEFMILSEVLLNDCVLYFKRVDE